MPKAIELTSGRSRIQILMVWIHKQRLTVNSTLLPEQGHSGSPFPVSAHPVLTLTLGSKFIVPTEG